MREPRTHLDAELLTALRELLERLNRLRMSEPDDEAASDLQRGIRDRITEIEKRNNGGNGSAAA